MHNNKGIIVLCFNYTTQGWVHKVLHSSKIGSPTANKAVNMFIVICVYWFSYFVSLGPFPPRLWSFTSFNWALASYRYSADLFGDLFITTAKQKKHILKVEIHSVNSSETDISTSDISHRGSFISINCHLPLWVGFACLKNETRPKSRIWRILLFRLRQLWNLFYTNTLKHINHHVLTNI